MYGGSCCNKQWRKRMARKKINTKTKQRPYKGHRFLKSIKEGDFFSTTTGLVMTAINVCRVVYLFYKNIGIIPNSQFKICNPTLR